MVAEVIGTTLPVMYQSWRYYSQFCLHWQNLQIMALDEISTFNDFIEQEFVK